jgi:coproporphyrinogen III oxidase
MSVSQHGPLRRCPLSLLQAMSSRGRTEVDPKGGQPYAAAAMSLVFHSAHPLVPTLRADVRLFQV